MQPDPRPVTTDQERPEPATDHEVGFELPAPPRIGRSRLVLAGAIALTVLLALFLIAYLPARRARTELVSTAAARAERPARVRTIQPRPGPLVRTLRLPGDVQALRETAVYARATGYVQRWYADLGDHVRTGQLLARIETPDLDQELDQARAGARQAEAAEAQARANLELARVTLRRYEHLAPTGYVSRQELEQRQADAAVQEANVQAAIAARRAQEASVRRLAELKGFADVVAPFAGTITARPVEVGNLITAGTAGDRPLFRLAATDPVRVFVQVPQYLSTGLQVGSKALLTVNEHPGRRYEGTVARTAGALDPASRTMTAEVHVPNPRGELLVGMYGEVEMRIPDPHPALAVPGTAVLATPDGLRVATVVAGHVHLQPVKVDRDTGTELLVTEGLAPGDAVIVDPSASLREGSAVELADR